VARLITDNFINEERFALMYAGGKFRIKQWGRIKIRAGLRQHQVSEANISKALSSLDGEGYTRAIRLLARKKAETITTADRRRKYQATYAYLVQRGFEPDLVTETLTGMMGEPNNYEFRT
jgi:regulatory protein